jgi:hypothetical protein
MSHPCLGPLTDITVDVNMGVVHYKMGEDLEEDYTIANRMYRVAMDSWSPEWLSVLCSS